MEFLVLIKTQWPNSRKKKKYFPMTIPQYVNIKQGFFFLDTCSYLCAHVCEGQRSTPGITSHVLSTLLFIFWYVFPLAWASLIRQGWLTSKLQGFSCLYLPSNDITRVHHPIWLFTWVLRPELGSSCLQTERFTYWATSNFTFGLYCIRMFYF